MIRVLLYIILFYSSIGCGLRIDSRSNMLNDDRLRIMHIIYDDWFLEMSGRLTLWLNTYTSDKYLAIVKYEAERCDLDPKLILSIILVESRFNKYAISGQGAIGLMQIMPFWQSKIGSIDDDLFDVETNIRYGVNILLYYLKQENYNLIAALSRYNGSYPDTGYATLVMNAYNMFMR